MLLYLVQHGVPRSGEEDPERPLSPEGVEEVEKKGRFLAGLSPLRVFHSGKRRAAETAHILGSLLGAEVSEADGLSPMDEPSLWANRIKKIDQDTMLVGHLPHLSRLSSLLLCGGSDAGPVGFSMGGVVCLKRDEEGRWSVKWMVAPDLLDNPGRK